jgi:branched-chain amino acid transport system permease protein
MVLVVIAGLLTTVASRSTSIYLVNAIVAAAIVVGIYVFVGNSGVISFGHVSFVAVGAFAAGVLTVPAELKAAVLPDLFPVLRDHTIGTGASLAVATLVGAALAGLVGLPLMRLSGLAAGIATFAVLEITHNLLREWTSIGPGATTLSLVPESTGALEATLGASLVILVAFGYQRSRFGRMLRASREDPAAAQAVGISVHRQRLWAFTLSGALCGFAGGLYVHMLGSITTEQVYLDLTFLTLAMLVVGGATSLFGAVVGALAISGLDAFLGEAEQGIDVGFAIDAPAGTRLVVVSALMALVLILRPSGLTGGREFGWRRRAL